MKVPSFGLIAMQSSWQFDRVIDRESSPKGDEADRPDEEEEHEAGEIFADYRPIKLPFGRPHPDPAVETASLAAVEPPDITYQLHIQDLVEEGKLSGLQLESIVYACQRHDQLLPSGDRCGFFIGDGEHLLILSSLDQVFSRGGCNKSSLFIVQEALRSSYFGESHAWDTLGH